MRILDARQLEQSPALLDEVIAVLREDRLVCCPGHRQYSIAASLMSEDAVIRLVQAKRRSGKAPSLVLIPDVSMLAEVVEQIPVKAELLLKRFWPGQLTLLLQPSAELSSKVRKTIAANKPARVGVRVPAPGLTLDLVHRFGGPLLISSANLAAKVGSRSASNVRKNFNHTVDLMIDAGDIPDATPSTVVEVSGDALRVTREGAIPTADIENALREANAELSES
ncbi:MAG: L-threonylcarbamoyladenylate synthase [Polyangiaceae bacterium]|nr:L-threonylcarbamoyladenylate synthase [Polyangiaceae bacterium]